MPRASAGASRTLVPGKGHVLKLPEGGGRELRQPGEGDGSDEGLPGENELFHGVFRNVALVNDQRTLGLLPAHRAVPGEEFPGEGGKEAHIGDVALIHLVKERYLEIAPDEQGQSHPA